MDKAQARERRNRLLESAAAAELTLTKGVREMRAIAGMTQEEFAKHRGVSARAIKAIELGQGNPTVATLNRIGQFFGLEVAFVPVRRAAPADAQAVPVDNGSMPKELADVAEWSVIQDLVASQETILADMRKFSDAIDALSGQLETVEWLRNRVESETALRSGRDAGHAAEKSSSDNVSTRKKKSPRLS